MSFHPGRLRQALALAEMTRADLARATGLPAQRIASWAVEAGIPTADEVARVARALKVRPEFFGRGRPFAMAEVGVLHTCQARDDW